MSIIVPIIAAGQPLSSLLSSLQQKGFTTDTLEAQKAAINETYRRIIGMQRWTWLDRSATENLPSGANTLAPTLDVTTVGKMNTVRLTDAAGNGYDLEYVDYNEVRRLVVTDPQSRSTPTLWSYSNNVLHFYPTADMAYTVLIDYQLMPPSLVVDGDVAVIPPQYMDVLVWGAAMSLAYRERDWQQYSAAQSHYQSQLAEMIAETGVRSKQTHGEVGSSGFYDGYNANVYPYYTR